jgi:hypothetical protein
MKETPLGTNPVSFFEGRPGPGSEPVGGKYRSRLETGYRVEELNVSTHYFF